MTTSSQELQRLTSLFNAPCLLSIRKRLLWGSPHMVRPAMVSTKFGAGDLLIGLTPVVHRPCYYLVWIDATWFEESDELLREHLDDIIESIADEFGYRESDDTSPYRWPEEDTAGGLAWWKADPDDVLTPRSRAKLLKNAA